MASSLLQYLIFPLKLRLLGSKQAELHDAIVKDEMSGELLCFDVSLVNVDNVEYIQFVELT